MESSDVGHGSNKWIIRARDAGDCGIGAKADLADAVKVVFSKVYNVLD